MKPLYVKEHHGRSGVRRYVVGGALFTIVCLGFGFVAITIFANYTPTKWLVKEGMLAPEFAVVDIDGNEMKLEDFVGKYVLLDFWHTRCQPCLEDTPQLKAIHRSHRDSLFIIGLSVDSQKARVVEYVQDQSIEWLQVLDLVDNEGLVNELYAVPYYPTYYLINYKGRVVLKGPHILEQIQYKGLRNDYSSWF